MNHGTLIIEVVGDAWGGFKSASRQQRTMLEPLAPFEAKELRVALLRRPEARQMVYARPSELRFGDFKSLDDVRLILRTYKSESTTTDDGRAVRTQTIREETILEFTDPESQDLFNDAMYED